MTILLVRKLLRDIRTPLLVMCLLLLGFSAFWVKIAQRVTTEISPFFNGLAALSKINPKLMEEVVFKGPGKVGQSIMGGAEVRFERPNDFLSVELLHPVVLILSGLWAVGRTSSAVAGELDKGTMELLLSQPVPRGRLILAHGIVDLLVLPMICLSIIAGTQLGLYLVGPFTVDYTMLEKLTAGAPAGFKPLPGPAVLEVSADRQIFGTVNLFCMLFAFSGISIALSSFGRNRWITTGWAAFVYVLMFIVNVLGQLWDTAAIVRPFSLFFYYQPQKIWLASDWVVKLGSVNIPVVPLLLTVGVVGYLVSYWRFTTRDLPAPL